MKKSTPITRCGPCTARMQHGQGVMGFHTQTKHTTFQLRAPWRGPHRPEAAEPPDP